jgi:hypothetical protein
MSTHVTCKECGYGNAPGSKFCNNCGSKLPLSTHIICPNCTAQNTIDRIFCDNCGTRLHQEKQLPEEKPTAKEPPASSKAAFSLPARRPGETGDLDPKNVPDWLRTGDISQDEDDWMRLTDSPLPRPEDLHPNKETGDLPDWLLTDSDASPIIEAPSVISTELYRDLVERGQGPDLSDLLGASEGADLPGWLQTAPKEPAPENAQDEPEEEPTKSPTAVSPPTAGLTDWLTDKNWQEETTPAAVDAWDGGLTGWLNADEQPAESDDDDNWFSDFAVNKAATQQPAEENLTDWLSDFDDEEEPATAVDQPAATSLTSWLSADDTLDDGFDDEDELVDEAEPAMSDRLTSWLSDFDDEEEPATAVDQPATASLTSWLSADDTLDDGFDDEDEPVDEAEPAMSARLTSWLSDFDNEEPATAVDQPATASLTAWLSESDIPDHTETADDDIFNLAPFDDDDDDTFPDPFAEQPANATVDKSRSLLDVWNTPADNDEDTFAWLAEDAFPVEEPLPTEEEDNFDWVDDESDEEFASVFTTNLEDDTALPEWLANNATPDDFLAELNSEPMDEWPETFAEEQQTAASDLDWLQETGSLKLPPELQKEIRPPVPEDAQLMEEFGFHTDEPDWLADLTNYDTGKLAAQTPAEFAALMDEPTAAPPPLPESPVVQPAAPLPTPTTQETWDSDQMLAETDDISGDLPAWLSKLGATEEDQTAVGDGEELAPSDMPEWISGMRPASADLSRSTENLAGVPEELVGANLPDWLQPGDLETLSSDAAFFTDDKSDIPDWLGSDRDDTGEDSDIFDTDTRSILGSPGASDEWTALLNDLPTAEPAERSLYKAEIPEWIMDLKPTEMTGKKAPVSAEAPVEEGGPLNGLRGVVSIAPVIGIQHVLMPPPNPILDQAHQQQMILLHQLAQENTEAPTAVTEKSSRNMGALIQMLFAIILLVVLTLGLRGVQVLVLPTTASLAVTDMHTAVTDAAGETVLVAFDYTPAMSGELNPMADTLLTQLTDNGSHLIVLSESSAGANIGTTLTAPYDDVTNLGYLPGGSIGLRQLGTCLSAGNVCESFTGQAIAADVQQELADVTLIIVLTSERDNLLDWIEQVGTPSEIPVIVGITQSVFPIAAPYYNTGQLQGMLNGVPDTAVYQQTYDIESALPAEPLYNAQILGQLTAVIILIIGLLLYSITILLKKRQQA